MPKTRLTHAERWLASGHRYDDLQLWRELCTMLETRGLTPTSELPEHLAPLVFRDPENTYMAWLREELLVPVTHLRGHASTGGNGWRVRRDWRTRLEVMQDPTPDALLHWRRTLEPTLRATCLKREENIHILIHDKSVPDRHLRGVVITSYRCTLCTRSSWDTTHAASSTHGAAREIARTVHWCDCISRTGRAHGRPGLSLSNRNHRWRAS